MSLERQRDLSSPSRARTALTGTTVVLIATFLLRWVTIDFENDYFMHVAWAADMLRGNWPVRDFVEPGFPLQTFLAYAGFRLGGYQLVWEAAIACSLIACGAALTFLACRRIGIGPWIAAAVTLVAVTTYPRMYTYPKAFVYPLALYAVVHYLRHPGFRSQMLLGAVTAVAFLFRHDHGVWIAIPTVAAVVVFHAAQPRALVRAILLYGGCAALLVAPWLLWVAASGHAGQYFDFLFGQSRGLTNRGRLPAWQFSAEGTRPLVALAPIDFPIVGVRWAPEASSEQRRLAEARYGLEPIDNDAGDYRLVNAARENVAALIADPLVEDTRGIDRGTLRVPSGTVPWLYLQAQRYVPPIRVRILPGLIDVFNAGPWLTWVSFTVPWIAAAVALTLLATGRARDRETLIAIAAASLLSMITYQTLVRASPDSRLGDLAAATAMLFGWLLHRAWSVPGWAGRVLKPGVIALVVLTLGSSLAYGRVITRLGGAGIDGPVNFLRRAGGQSTLYGSRPLDLYAPPGATGLPGLARWLNECTGDADRVSVIGFEPQVFVLSERGFAGGLAFYDLGWNSSDRDQALTIARWSRQHVPVILAMATEWESFSRDYPAVRAFIDTRYEERAHSSFGGGKALTVLTDRTASPRGTHAGTGLPCFR